MAESRGFEPLKPCSLHAFQACALDHYANSPEKYASSIEKMDFFAKWFQKTLSEESVWFILVTPRRVELRFTGWKPAVLTARRWGQNKKSVTIFYFIMVGKTRLELATPASQTQCASQLRHFPTYSNSWWVCLDLNQGPRPYQRRALTNWATHPNKYIKKKEDQPTGRQAHRNSFDLTRWL